MCSPPAAGGYRQRLLRILFFRHRMHVPVKRTAITQIEKARLRATAQRMRHFGRQTDECLTVEIPRAAIVSDVSEAALKPDVSLVAAVTVIGYRETRWKP